MPYLVRLLSLSLASFFLLHAVLSAILAALAPAAMRLAGRMEPRRAAGVLFVMRLFPSVVAGLVVAALCVPSYLWLEPDAASEGVGLVCLAAAALGAGVLGISVARGARAIAGSAQFLRDCRRSASRTGLPGQASPVWVVERAAPPVVALAGVVRPRFVISSQVIGLLSPCQLELALLHERAHLDSHDNLKRLLVILAPDPFPFVDPWASLERNWARFTEWAADDKAAGGDAERSLSLAAALVSVAGAGSRRAANPGAVPLVASFADHGGADLAVRVDRLLEPAISRLPGRVSGRWFARLVNASIAIPGCAIVLLALNRPVLAFVHEILERLIA